MFTVSTSVLKTLSRVYSRYNPKLLMEAALVEAAARLRVSQPDLTALQLHTLITKQTEFVSATLSEVKKASSKASKQLAKMPAETPTPAPALPARSARSANDPHDLTGVFKGYGAAMRRAERLDISRSLEALKTALQHCERTQPQDSLIRAALLDKMSMYQWMLDDKASELHTHGDGGDDSDSDTSSSATSNDSAISWLVACCQILLSRYDQGIQGMFTFRAAEWAFVDPRSRKEAGVYDTWCEVLGLETFLLATHRIVHFASSGSVDHTAAPFSCMLQMAPLLIEQAQVQQYVRQWFNPATRQYERVSTTARSPISKLQRTILNQLADCLDGPALDEFMSLTRVARSKLPAEDVRELEAKNMEKMSKAAAEHDAKLGRHICALPDCGKVERRAMDFPSCGRCRTAKYCCAEHQTAHWRGHKSACKGDTVQALIYQEEPGDVGFHESWRCPVHGHRLLGLYPASCQAEFGVAMSSAEGFYRCPEQGTGGCSNRGGLVTAGGFGRRDNTFDLAR